MKVQLNKKIRQTLKSIVPVAIIMLMLVLPNIVFGQNPGDNPDAQPQAVPLDSNMTLLLIAVGAFLAVKVMRRGLKTPQSQGVITGS